MESRNPVFARSKEFHRGGYATFGPPTPTADDLQSMYESPSATPAQTGRMTLDDVVLRTAMLFGVLLVTAGISFLTLSATTIPLVFGAMIAGLVLALVISFTSTPRPALILAYAAVEGVFVGGLSRVFELRWHGIVAQAVLGTLAAFGAMLALYKSGRVRATPRFTRTLLIAGWGYLAFGLVHLLGVWFGWWQSIYWGANGPSLLGVAASAFGVVLSALYLVLDFDFIEQGIRNGLPQRYAWTAAFGLVVTLVWVYLEMLRLIAILRGND